MYALVDVNVGQKTLSIHRLVQTSFIHYLNDSELQTMFNSIASLLNARFPKQEAGRPFTALWPQCEKYIQHATSLAIHSAILPNGCHFDARDEIVELLSNCCWYLHEKGDPDNCLKLLDISKGLCIDKESSIYSHLLNTAGCLLFEQNKLMLTRESLELCLSLRQKIFPEDNEDLLCTVNNLANLEVAEGRYDRALVLYQQVKRVKQGLGPASEVALALTYTGLARAYLGNKSYRQAKENLDQAYNIINRHLGAKGHYMAG
jgi:tetratricopeptide (TPR) repeat protein